MAQGLATGKWRSCLWVALCATLALTSRPAISTPPAPATSVDPATVTADSVAVSEDPVPDCAEKPHPIFVTIKELRSQKGNVAVELYNDDAEHFIKKAARLMRVRVRAESENKTVRTCLPAPGPGTYAVVIYHDENDNHKWDRNWIGLPKEGVGFSRNPKLGLKKPKHKKAAFVVADEAVELDVVVRYFGYKRKRLRRAR